MCLCAPCEVTYVSGGEVMPAVPNLRHLRDRIPNGTRLELAFSCDVDFSLQRAKQCPPGAGRAAIQAQHMADAHRAPLPPHKARKVAGEAHPQGRPVFNHVGARAACRASCFTDSSPLVAVTFIAG